MDFQGFSTPKLWEVWCVIHPGAVSFSFLHFHAAVFGQQKFRLRRLWWGPLQRPSLSGEGHRENLGKTPELKGVWVQKNNIVAEKRCFFGEKPGSFLMVFLFSGRFFLLEKTWECFEFVFCFLGRFGDVYESWRPYLSWLFHRRAIFQ